MISAVMRKVAVLAIGMLLLAATAAFAVAQQPPSPPLGGEKATFNIPPFIHPTYTNVTSFRQNLCPRYEQYRLGQIALRDALRGLEIRSIVHWDQFFRYSEEGGIDPEYPGVPGHLMDLIAAGAGFTWRNSFAYHGMPFEYNMTWTQLLWWGANTYDIAVNNWDHSLARMELGVTYVEPWYDGSIILIDKLQTNNNQDDWDISVLINWSRPFDLSVWILIVFTIFVSGVVYQLIEHMQGEQQDRPFGQWFMDNLYLSILNFTTNFEYAPSSASGRIFAVSMAIWALVISATYTANLASLFVEQTHVAASVASIEEAASKKYPICTFQDTNSDTLIRERYKTAERRPRQSELEMYQSIQAGGCKLLADSRSGWDIVKGYKEYNPYCNLQPVGETVAEVKSGFAMKADVGYKCTSLIRDVFNLYLRELIDKGELDNAWKRQRAESQDIDCDADVPEAISQSNGQSEDSNTSDGKRQRRKLRSPKPEKRRRLIVSTQSTSSNDSSGNQNALTLQQMMGTFVLHYGMMLLAIFVSLVSPCWTKLTKSWGWLQPEPLIIRSHGPMVGPPPTIETSSRRSVIQAYGSPIGHSSKRMHINTYVIPEKAPMDGHSDYRRRGSSDVFAFDHENSYNYSNQILMGRSHPAIGTKQEIRIDGGSFCHLKEHFDAELQRTAEKIEKRVEQKLEEKMNLQMRMFALMLKDSRSTDIRYSDTGVLHAQPPREEPSIRKRDFGQYLRHQSRPDLHQR